jgi:hypothetical protein
MGYTGDIMHAIAEKELKRNYPLSDGWVLRPESKKIGKDEIFTLIKKRGGKNETAFVGITFEKTLDNSLIQALLMDAGSPAAARTTWYCALIAPQGIDQGNIPDTIKVIYMRSFKYEDSSLVWLKHPTQKPSVKSSSQTTG